jgi:hypothetical protein
MMSEMLDGEQLVAEQHVSLRDRPLLRVSISQHTTEDFWRVQVSDPGTARRQMSTTVAPGESFLMKLIQEAVGGDQSAWHHLAQWGHTNLTRPATGFRAPAV